VAEGARLESVFTRKGNVGSNPTLSAIFQNHSQTCWFRDPVTIFSGLRLLKSWNSHSDAVLKSVEISWQTVL
jgi:hypothetical protein